MVLESYGSLTLQEATSTLQYHWASLLREGSPS